LHVATAFGPAGHGLQLAPHVLALRLLSHALAQEWKLVSHVKPQWPLLHAAVPLVTDAQLAEH
jgi:hypothetical protein